MKTLKFICLSFIGFAFIMGCSGNNANIKNLSEDKSKVTQQELIKNWSDYDIWLSYNRGYPPLELLNIIFDTKNDNKEIVVEHNGGIVKVKDQQMWTEVVKENTTGDGDFWLVTSRSVRGVTRVSKITDSDNQLFGYVIYHDCCPVNTSFVGENTLRLDVGGNNAGGAP